jgi:RHS repeat-associated protein
VSPRWVGSGWTIFNNKGKAVRQFEPFFADTHRPDFDVRAGASSVLFYDPLERVVATIDPNDTYSKVVFDPWLQATYDVNDTVALDPRNDPDIKDYVTKYLAAQPTGWRTWLHQRIANPDNAPADTNGADPERDAAVRTLKHAGTPTTTHLDSLGRTFLTVAHNGNDAAGRPVRYETRVGLDIEGNPRSVLDAKGRIVMRYDYDMLGTRVHQASMEAGERWILNDVSGKALLSWDSRGHNFATEQDRLRRPVAQSVRGTDSAQSDPRTIGKDIVFAKTEHGEGHPQAAALNLLTRVYRQYDGAGMVTNEEYDFKGNLLRTSRQVGTAHKDITDWASAAPSGQRFSSSTSYDALNRPVSLVAPDGTVVRPMYNAANLLDRLEANLRGRAEVTRFVTNIDYNAKGQRVRIDHGTKEGARISTSYEYDPATFRLITLTTRRNAGNFDATDRPGEVQNLSYTYDPAGNITHIRDAAQETIHFRNRRVEPSSDYRYDSIYRLIEATGREHLGQSANGAPLPPAPSSYNDWHRIGLPHPGDGNAMGTYRETYAYDEVGNFLQMTHRGTDPTHPGWTRDYVYAEPSLLEAGKHSNRLTSTSASGVGENYSTAGDGYDAHGNMLRMPHLPVMRWDFQDRLLMTQRQKLSDQDEDGVARHGERTWYVYDASGQRVRKVTESDVGNLKHERIYLGGFEIYRRYGTGALERETVQIMDDKQRIALVETETSPARSAPVLIRYQFGNHLGSASVELDDQANVVSYEEYTPFGSTSYQAVWRNTEVPAKRYRYIGQERDEESGLYLKGARYFAPWVGRWVSPDPFGVIDGVNLYQYARANPICFKDSTGGSSEDFSDLNGVVDDLNRSELKINLVDERTPLQPGKSPMSKKEAREYGNKQAERYRNAAGMNQGADVQAGHTAAARHAPESGISKEDWDKQQMQELHSRRGRGLDVEVEDQGGKTKTTTRHRSQEGLIDDAVERSKAVNAGKLTPQGQLDAAAEVKWRTENVPMDQRDVDRLRNSGPAAPGKGPPVDPSTGKVISKEAKAAAAEGLEKTGKGAKALAKLGKAGRHFAAAIPFLGIAAGQASAAHAASQGDYAGALMDEAGFIPVAGDLLDAARGGYALGEVANELLVDEDMAMSHGEVAKAAMQKLGAGETVSNIVGGLAAAGSALGQVAVKLSPVGMLFW